METLDGCDEVGVRLDFCGQLVAHGLEEIVAGRKIGGFVIRYSLLVNKHQSHHDRRHVLVPSLPTPDLVVGDAAGWAR